MGLGIIPGNRKGVGRHPCVEYGEGSFASTGMPMALIIRVLRFGYWSIAHNVQLNHELVSRVISNTRCNTLLYVALSPWGLAS